ncbi:aromatic ring-hydroxylating oxygenase subunit alpha [Rhodococcus wratislaviensis]|uniref:aromatic ring-hydroxylating oxygenase subunit alpha n=1 Tax=Rhodococcus wratislaviensis TaxID=44752 RepID=UPI003648C96F
MTTMHPPLRKAADEYTGPPKQRFFGEEWFERDLEAIWRPRWLIAGHVDELDANGKYGYLTYSIGDDELLIRRAPDGTLRAFYNVCPHRGARLCDGPSGKSTKRIVCPYHLWSFSPSDGALTTSREMHDDFDREAYGLTSAHVDVWHGLIFICLADEPPAPLHEYLADVTLGAYDLSGMKLAAFKSHTIEANWKLVIENNLECYHCVVNHPELTAVVDWRYFATDDFDEHCSMRADGLEAASFPARFTNPLAGSPLCAVPAPRTDGSAEYDPLHSQQGIFEPGVGLALQADHGWFFVPRPLGPERTELRQYWFVARDAVEGVDYDVDNLTNLFDSTMKQDTPLVESLQQGMRQRSYRPGPFNRVHQAFNAGFYRWYEANIEARFPEIVARGE